MWKKLEMKHLREVDSARMAAGLGESGRGQAYMEGGRREGWSCLA